ncbi:hypothetical protein DICPUDRAFT_83035 [Dictyostelium purpureum]|uniref:Uncharacterized protein n=1 Tax=Dictyostelium purpureum TaxID=5786 RepID=F0ZYC5_DICPU|nr:uncharacterized protein DICPUDRAFT_83035 [Dictyostelium purpureum]EGC31062.1 hypothetical protein DICPUDRAFT_83035 [Dictyostelium purpureum]|eukprot:XP_003292421.1 hypothetical protein DICPUDRAFT_83035 [Dictyostelium purpureum]
MDANASYYSFTVEHTEGMQVLESRTQNLIMLYGHDQKNENKVEKLEWLNINIYLFYIYYLADETISLCSENGKGLLDEIYQFSKKTQLSETKLKLVFIIDSYDGSLKEDDASRLKITLDYLKYGSKPPKCSNPYGLISLPRPFNNVSLRDSLKNDFSPLNKFLINRINSDKFGRRLFYKTANILASEFWSEFINHCSNLDPNFLIKVAEHFIQIDNVNSPMFYETIKKSITQREFKILSNGNDSNVFMFKF